MICFQFYYLHITIKKGFVWNWSFSKWLIRLSYVKDWNEKLYRFTT